MKPIHTTLEHRILFPQGSSAVQHPALLLLHGRGADEEDLIGLAEQFDPRFLILSVRAPYPFPNGGYTWYDLRALGAPQPTMFRLSYDRLSQFVDDALSQYPVDPAQVYLFGFSMGTVMAYALAFTRPSLFRGVVANSGYIPEGTHLTFQWNHLEHMEILIAHGTLDPVIPVDVARRAKRILEGSNARVSYREYPMGHEINQESLRDSAAFIQRLLDAREV
ncbi:MAG TPA: alpha/beta fold hydrolase [Bacteroidota bacterium]|nr:alpha/beta fold hydrolase [Bacteroidota bacterium]